MSDRIKWVNHKAHKILYCDYSVMRPEAIMPEIVDAEKKTLENGLKVTLVLNNFTQCYMSKQTKERAVEYVRKANVRGIKIITACMGISGLQRLIAQAVVRDMYFAKSEEDAKDWLVEQALKESK